MAAVFFCGWLTTIPASAQEKPQGPPPTPVVVAPIEQRTVAPVLDLVGVAQANRISQAASETSGLVKAVNFAEGDSVEAGAPLVTLDAGNISLELKAARAETAQRQVLLDEARKDLERSAVLKQSRTISEQSYEKDAFKVRTLELTLAAAEAKAARLADTISRMTVKAPFSGQITAKQTETGQWLGAGAPVATLVDISKIKVRAPLPERYLQDISAGDEAQVAFDALGGRTFNGQVTAIIPQAEEKSHSLPVEVTLENPEGLIKPGILARVQLTRRSREALLTPKDSLVLDRDRATLFVVRDNQAQPVEVTVGAAVGPLVEVIGGVEPGDLVVVQGNERLRPGQPVQIVEGGQGKGPRE